MDIFTKKAKVRSEQKTYDKNNMLMQKSKDIRAKFARNSCECECRYGCEYDCARGCEFERDFGFFLMNLRYIMTDSSYNSCRLNSYDF